MVKGATATKSASPAGVSPSLQDPIPIPSPSSVGQSPSLSSTMNESESESNKSETESGLESRLSLDSGLMSPAVEKCFVLVAPKAGQRETLLSCTYT